jgi:hypothetical protein
LGSEHLQRFSLRRPQQCDICDTAGLAMFINSNNVPSRMLRS